MAQWKTPEEEYIHSLEPISVRVLSEKWGVPYHRLRWRAFTGKWGEKRQLYLAKAMHRWEERAIERELSRLEQVDQHADPLYETALTLIGAKLSTIAKLVTDNPDAAGNLDARELDILMSASTRAHNQRRLIYGGVTGREEQKTTGEQLHGVMVVPGTMSKEEWAMRATQHYEERRRVESTGQEPTNGGA